MSIQQKIWDYINSNNIVTKIEIIESLKLNKTAVISYISALYKNNYLIFCASSKRAGNKDNFKLIKKTGKKAPLLNYGILKDFNLKEELKVGKELRISENFNAQINLKDILDSFLEIGKDEVILKDVSKIFLSKKNLNTKFGNSFLKRWIEKLENINAITFTNNTYRNSKIYLVNLEKIKEIKSNIDLHRDYRLFF